MKTIKNLSTFFFFILSLQSYAQAVQGLRAQADGKMGEFTEWVSKDVGFDDGTSATFEYRIALMDRKGIGCHYEVEIKNTSSIKLSFKLDSNYYDKLVKSHFGDVIKESLKPGKSFSGKFVAQGCKKEKGIERDDYGNCIACDFFVDISVSKK